MNRPKKSASEKKKRTLNNRIITAFTAVAIIIAVVAITMSRASVPDQSTDKLDTTTETSQIETETSSTENGTTSFVSLPTASVSKGSTTAPVTIIMYSDFICAQCQLFALNVEKELETTYVDTGKVRVIYKFMIAYGTESYYANLAAACAAEQGQFWPYYYLLMAQRASPSVEDLSTAVLQKLAQQIGLDMEKFNDSLLSEKYKDYILQNHEEGIAMGVTGTPSFFINGTKKAGASKLQSLQNIIDPLLEQLGE